MRRVKFEARNLRLEKSVAVSVMRDEAALGIHPPLHIISRATANGTPGFQESAAPCLLCAFWAIESIGRRPRCVSATVVWQVRWVLIKGFLMR
jgi:hypothetical protein